MRWYKLDIKNLVVEYLGSLFGQPVMQKWCYVMLYPLIELWEQYDEWRRRQFYSINITSQIISMRNFLNDQFDPIDRRIIISKDNVTSGVYIALESELEPFLELPLDGEDELVPIALEEDYNPADNLIVIAPISLQDLEDKIFAAIQDKRVAGALFQLVFK